MGGSPLRPLGPEAVIERVEYLAAVEGLGSVRVRELTERDSSEFDPPMWAELCALVEPLVDEAPVLITHGTDTLAWSAAALAVALRPAHPVVLTGAVAPLGAPGSDAGVNLEGSLGVLGSLPPGVWVAFHGERGVEVHQAGFVRKTGRPQAPFVALAGAPYAVWDFEGLSVCGTVHFIDELLEPFGGWRHVDGFTRPVEVLRAWPGLRPFEVHGDLAVELYGSLTAPPAVLELARSARQAGYRLHACRGDLVASESYEAAGELVRAGAVVHDEAPIELVACALMRS